MVERICSLALCAFHRIRQDVNHRFDKLLQFSGMGLFALGHGFNDVHRGLCQAKAFTAYEGRPMRHTSNALDSKDVTDTI